MPAAGVKISTKTGKTPETIKPGPFAPPPEGVEVYAPNPSRGSGYTGTSYYGSNLPETITKVTSPTTTESTSAYTPSGPRPTYGETVRANLPGAPELPTYVRPERGVVDPYVAPEYDEARIATLTQRAAAPGVRTLRMALRETTARRGGEYNPNVRAMTLRKALQGYGTGLESIYGGAAKTAGEEYAREYGIETEEAKINYSQAVADRDAIFSADLHATDANFQAAISNIKMVYGAEVAAELQYTADQNAQNAVIFETAMNEYLRLGTTKTTSRTSGGTVTQTTGKGVGTGRAGAPLNEAQAWDRWSKLLHKITRTSAEEVELSRLGDSLGQPIFYNVNYPGATRGT